MADVSLVNWTAAEYHASDALSRSDLALFDSSARLYHGRRIAKTIEQPKPTEAMCFGTLTHLRVLEPDEFRRIVWVRPEDFDGRTRDGKAEMAAVKRDGRLPVTMVDEQRIEGIAAAVLACPAARKILDVSEPEVTYTWTETVAVDDGARVDIPCRARLDLEARRGGRALITDLKTCDDPSPAAFLRSVAKYGYHFQPPFYSKPLREQLGTDPVFRFIAVRSSAPFEVVVYEPTPAALRIAEARVAKALRRLAQCIATNTWSSPWEGTKAQPVHALDLPPWLAEDRT